MADGGIDTGESNVQMKYIRVLFLHVGHRRELRPLKDNAELGRSGSGLVGAAAIYGAVLPLSAFHLVISHFLLLVMPQERLMGEEDRGYCMNARTQLRTRRLRGSPGAIHGQFVISHVTSLRESYCNSRAVAPSLSPTDSDPQTNGSISQRHCCSINIKILTDRARMYRTIERGFCAGLTGETRANPCRSCLPIALAGDQI